MSAKPVPASSPERLYSIQLLELDRLIAEGFGDAPEADAVRDLMDDQWNRMTSEQKQRMRWLSVDLDRLAEERYAVKDDSPEQAAWAAKLPAALEERTRGNCEPLLAHLREDRSFGAPGGVAFMQGRMWDALGFPEVGVRFLEYSERVSPDVAAESLETMASGQG